MIFVLYSANINCRHFRLEVLIKSYVVVHRVFFNCNTGFKTLLEDSLKVEINYISKYLINGLVH